METTWPATQRSASAQLTPTKLDPKAFGLTCGLMWGLGLFSLTWWIIALDGPSREPTGIGKVYRGYTITPGGSLLGLVWGFVDAFVGGTCFAWLYNHLREHRESQ
jgi:hypothetical protein